ncbi:MAG: DUF2157 domain-containing protein [Butyricimonas faecihominis]
MKLNKSQGDLLKRVIERWEADGTIDVSTADRLKGSYTVRSFEWKELAKYSFWIAIVCGVIAVVLVLADHLIMDLLERLFLSSYSLASGVFAVGAVLVYYWGGRRRKRMPYKVFSNETILFLGVLLTAVSVGYLGAAMDNGSGHFSLLFLLAAVIYARLGFYFSSVQVWVFALLSLGAWYGAETGYLSDWGNHFLGLNYPQRYVAFGGLLVACRFLLAGKKWFTTFDYSTYVVGMLYLFISLWFLSIFGNSESWIRWYSTKQVELWAWNLLILFGSVVAIFVGLKRDDAVARGFGITFSVGYLHVVFLPAVDVMHAGLFFYTGCIFLVAGA